MITTILIAAGPAIAAIVGSIISVVKNNKGLKEVIDEFGEVKQEVKDTKQFNQLKEQLLICQKENMELKILIKELLTKADHISRD